MRVFFEARFFWLELVRVEKMSKQAKRGSIVKYSMRLIAQRMRAQGATPLIYPDSPVGAHIGNLLPKKTEFRRNDNHQKISVLTVIYTENKSKQNTKKPTSLIL